MHYFLVKPGGKERRGTIALYDARSSCIELFLSLSRIEATNQEIPNNQLGFHIITQEKMYYMYADTDQETKEWIDAVRTHKVCAR